MEKREVLRSALLATALFVVQSGRAQVSTPFNVPTTPGSDYVGWDNSTTVPLEIRHDADQPIDWYTEMLKRITLLPNSTYTIGAFGGQVKDGHMLLSPDAQEFLNNVRGPYSILHLAAATDNAQQLSYRPWMSTGVTFTGNADHGYVGQKGKELDYTDMIIHWSDNPGEFMKDRMRFIFTSGFDAMKTSGAQSEEGLEFMRMWPNRYEDPHIGVGDFCTALCSL